MFGLMNCYEMSATADNPIMARLLTLIPKKKRNFKKGAKAR
jgi:hypothetical protein